MPKIFINEQDNTSPGRPGSYANYAVLLAGFMADANAADEAKLARADENGVYEFNSAQDFEETIGAVAPSRTQRVKETATTNKEINFVHYGNQMAYELLKLGYKVIYKPITSVEDLADESFWEVFKDRASYDFRFITHGLLSSVDVVGGESYQNACEYFDAINRALAVVDEAKQVVDNAVAVAEAVGETVDAGAFKTELFDTLSSHIAEEPEKYTNTSKFFAIANDNIPTNYAGIVTVLTTDGGVDGVDSMTNNYATYDSAIELLNSFKEIINQELRLYGGIPTAALLNNANRQIVNIAAYPDSKDNTAVADVAIDTLPGRGDCIALIELDERTYKDAHSKKPEVDIINGIKKMSDITAGNKGKYCALTVPSVEYDMNIEEPFNNATFPGAFHYLTCFANSLGSGYAEWYAAAGYTRGVSTYAVKRTTVKLGELAINALEPRNIDDAAKQPPFACNVIANFRNSYYLWGNRTAHHLGKKGGDKGDLIASSYLNIRQLCTTIKKQLYTSCRAFTFDPNSDTLWVNFTNSIRPTLERMKADQGIRDYRIVKVAADKKATLKARIRIIPIEAVEDFDLEISLDDSFGETVATIAG